MLGFPPCNYCNFSGFSALTIYKKCFRFFFQEDTFQLKFIRNLWKTYYGYRNKHVIISVMCEAYRCLDVKKILPILFCIENIKFVRKIKICLIVFEQ